MSGGSAENTSLYKLGTRFIEGMPTLASVTPAVPPMMIMSAGMLMNEAGLVPSIIELSSREPNASAIPIAVAAFIASLHRPPGKILQSWPAGLHERSNRATQLARLVLLGFATRDRPRPPTGAAIRVASHVGSASAAAEATEARPDHPPCRDA